MRSRDDELPLALEVQRTEEELHIYDGLVIAMRDPHAMLDALLHGEDPDDAGLALQERFDLDGIQARAVLDIQLRRATARDRRRIEDRRRELADHLRTSGAWSRPEQAGPPSAHLS